MSEVYLNYTLKVQEKEPNYSFQNDFILSISGKVINMPKFLRLDLYCPIFRAREINRTVPAPDGADRTKNSARLGINIIKSAETLVKTASKNKFKINHPMTYRPKFPFTLSCTQ